MTATSMRRVTIRDVALAAGVSVSTISKVVNGRSGIAADTQERVRAVVEEMGYVGAVGAQTLRRQKTGVVGVLVSRFEPYSAEVLKGVSAAIEGSGYELMAWSGVTKPGAAASGWERRLLGRLAGGLIDGAIVVTPSVTPPVGGFPLVVVDPHELSDDTPTVRSDDAGGARRATAHLLSLGHTRIGFLGGRHDLASARAREDGFRQAMAAAGVAVDPRLVAHGDYTNAGAMGPARHLLTQEQRPTAIFAANDVSALRVITEANRLGLSVPEELSVIGFDDVPEAAKAAPRLTTMAQPMQQLGATAMEMLLRLLRDQAPTRRHACLSTQLIVRGSTAPLR